MTYADFLSPRKDIEEIYTRYEQLTWGDHIGFSEFLVATFYTLVLNDPLLRGDAIDAGANAGHHTARLCLLLNSHEKRVVAIEPNPVHHALIRQNVLADMSQNLILLPDALSYVAGEEVTFFAMHDPQQGRVAPRETTDFHGQTVSDTLSVKTTTLEKVIADHDLSPAFIKVDVEGLDVKVGLGMGPVLSRFRPFVMLEVAPHVAESPQEFLALFDLFTAQDYLCLDVFGHVYDRDVWMFRGEKNPVHWNRFFVPAEWGHYLLPALRRCLRSFWQTIPAFRECKFPG
jgi:FkbM family methyltransferase